MIRSKNYKVLANEWYVKARCVALSQ